MKNPDLRDFLRPDRDAKGRILAKNINHPGVTHPIDAARYFAMAEAMQAALPQAPPGLTQSEMRAAVIGHLPQDLFPGGAKADWWSKAVQLDLEARGFVQREKCTPLRWYWSRSEDSQ